MNPSIGEEDCMGNDEVKRNRGVACVPHLPAVKHAIRRLLDPGGLDSVYE